MKPLAEEIRVWDIAVRLFHWTLVISFSIAYLTEDDFEWLHVNSGYLVLGLVIFRIVWGFMGTQHARFTDFVHPPIVVYEYVKHAVKFRAPRYLGHNPAGGAMIMLLLLMLLITAISGLFVYGIEDVSGPLAGVLHGEFYADIFEELHEFSANMTLLLVILHIAGVIFSSIEHGENLIRAMVTGNKRMKSE